MLGTAAAASIRSTRETTYGIVSGVRIEDAIEVFARGFSFTRSFTHPYLVERVGPLWLMRDAPRKRPEYRNEEWLVYGVSAAEADAIIQANRRERYAVCAFRMTEESDGPLREDWKSAGYRLQTTEMLFAHDLDLLSPVKCSCAVARVTARNVRVPGLQYGRWEQPRSRKRGSRK